MASNAQGSTEYLLLIGGGVLVAVIVISLFLGIASTNEGQAGATAEQYFNLLRTSRSDAGIETTFAPFDDGPAPLDMGDLILLEADNVPLEAGWGVESINCIGNICTIIISGNPPEVLTITMDTAEVTINSSECLVEQVDVEVCSGSEDGCQTELIDIYTCVVDFGGPASLAAKDDSEVVAYFETGEITITIAGSDGYSASLIMVPKEVMSTEEPTARIEFGKVVVQDLWKRVNLRNTFINPIIIAKPVSANGIQPAHVRLKIVTGNSFDIKLEEWMYENQKHGDETIFYMAIEKGIHYFPDGRKIIAGKHNQVNNDFTQISFPVGTFSSTPVIFAESQTYNDGQPIVTRNREITTAGFEAMVQEEEAGDQYHVMEVVGYVAAEPGSYPGFFDIGVDYPQTQPFVVFGIEINPPQTQTPIMVEENWIGVLFQQYLDPSNIHIIFNMQGFEGSDTANLRYSFSPMLANPYQSATGFIARLKVEEEQSFDAEVDHKLEKVGYVIGTDSCGNDVIDVSEFCDGADLGGQTCQSLGYDVGTLSCNNMCSFDVSQCYNSVPEDGFSLVNGKVYPYDPGYSGSRPYTASVFSNGSGVIAYSIQNSAEKWVDPSGSFYDLGPLYPTRAGQSLTNVVGSPITFGQSDYFPDGTPGKDFISVEFLGFEGNEERTVIEIGTAVTGLDSAAMGGISYKDSNNMQHNIPLALKLSDIEAPFANIFLFDTKTIMYDVNYGENTGLFNLFDLDVHVFTGDVINGRTWTITNTSDTTVMINVAGIGPIIVNLSSDLTVGTIFSIDGVSYKLIDNDVLAGTNDVMVAVDGVARFWDWDNGKLLYNSNLQNSNIAATDSSNGKLYFTEGQVFDGSSLAATGNPVSLMLEGANYKDFYYAFSSSSTLSQTWLLLGADRLGAGESGVIQNNKTIDFLGTVYLVNGNSTESKVIPETFWDGSTAGTITVGSIITAGYFVPQSPDFNSGYAFSDVGNSYFVAVFRVNDNVTPGADIMVYLDAFDGGNLGPFRNNNLTDWTNDLDVNALAPLALKSGTVADGYQEAYTDAGTKIWLLDDDAGVKISSPQNPEMIEFVVSFNQGDIGFSYYLDSGSDTSAVEMNLSGSHSSLINDSKFKEQILLTADAKMDTSSDIKDLVTKIDSGGIIYQMDVKSGNILNIGNCAPLFGQYYKVTDVQVTGIPSITFDLSTRCAFEGGFVTNLNGAGEPLKLKLVSVAQDPTTFLAGFELYDSTGALIQGVNDVAAGTQLDSVFGALETSVLIETIDVDLSTGVAHVELEIA